MNPAHVIIRPRRPAAWLVYLALAACNTMSSTPPCRPSTEIVRPSLRARLVATRSSSEGAPKRRAEQGTLWRVRLVLTNTGPNPLQLAHSSYERYYFFKLRVAHVGADEVRTTMSVHGDIYPAADMELPLLRHTVLAPGASLERDMTRLLREGYGGMRQPGTYELVGVYASEPSDMSGDPDVLFEEEAPPEPSVRPWRGRSIETAPLKIRVTP